MGNHTYSRQRTITTIILCSLLANTGALALDNAYDAATYLAGARHTPAATSLQAPSDNDCYRGGRNRQLMLRITDLSSLWHYATRILLPTNGASVAPRNDEDARKTEQGLVWRVGTENGGVVVSANVDW